ncbi:MAG: NUDIX domain-containing protein [Opitutales bacterium]
MRPVRTAARALILQEGRLLCIRMQDKRGQFYILPGGGQQPGETLEQTLLRECREEIAAVVRIEGLAYVREYIGRNHNFSPTHRQFHQVETVFRCTLLTHPEQLGQGHERDKKQVGFAWIPVDNLGRIDFLPRVIVPFFQDGGFHPPSRYLGDCN